MLTSSGAVVLSTGCRSMINGGLRIETQALNACAIRFSLLTNGSHPATLAVDVIVEAPALRSENHQT